MLATGAPHKIGWAILPMWVVATIPGWGFGLLPAMLLLTNGFSNIAPTDYNPSGPLGGILMCGMFSFACPLAVGFCQSVVLGRYFGQRVGNWLFYTLTWGGIAWLLGWAGGLLLFGSIDTSDLRLWLNSGIVTGTVVGLLTGIAQWRVLARLGGRSALWIPGSMLGWILGIAVYWLTYQVAGGPLGTTVTSYYEGGLWPKTVDAPGAGSAMLLAWAAGGLVLGAVTGVLMKLLLIETNAGEQAVAARD